MDEENIKKELTREEEVADLVPEEEMENEAAYLKRLKEKLKSCEAERKEYLDTLQRTRADYANSKKREVEENSRAVYFAENRLLGEIFGISDALEGAERSLPEDLPKSFAEGLSAIKGKLEAVLTSYGVERVTPDVGEEFKPAEAAAVDVLETEEENKDGRVAEVLQSGFRRKEDILRPASVRVFSFKKN